MKRLNASIAVLLACGLAAMPAEAQQKKKPPLAVVNNPLPAPLSGEVNVSVRGDENPIIRIQMVPGGQALVEFPARDRIFKVNPADPEMVTIEDSPTKVTDRYILLRSSKQFLPHSANAGASSAATTMLVQMTSGMVITLLVYPERDIDRVVHRCVIRYDRDSVVKARQIAGLAVNLDQREEAAPLKAVASIQMIPAVPIPVEAPEPESKIPTIETPPSTEPGPSKESVEPWSGKLKWSKPLHGLRAAVQMRTVNARERQVMVSVRNTLDAPLRIVPKLPELAIQTLDERERVLQVEPLKSRKTEASTADGLLAAGGTARYVITYDAPILGANQRLCVAIAQTNAADDPVIIELTKGSR